MNMVSTTPAPQERMAARLRAVFGSRPLTFALVVTAMATALRLSGTVDSDVASQLAIAARIHAGAALYRDVLEINPPLWFWMAIPVERLSGLFGVPAETLLIALFGVLVSLSVAATDRLIRHVAPPRRTLILVYVALILAVMPWVHVGEREQIVLIGVVPYAALLAARREGLEVSQRLAIAVGLGAALGYALKHYFLIAPALLELWLAGTQRRWRPVRPETVAIVAVGVIYAAALILEGDYLTRMVPLLRLVYGDFGPHSIRSLFGIFAITGIAILTFVAAHARLLANRKAPFASALLIAGLGFTVSYFVQLKGWPYHAIPLLGCGALALAALCAETSAPPRLLRILAPALMAFPLLLSADEAMHPAPPNVDLLDAVAGLRPGDPVGFLTTQTEMASTLNLQQGLRDPSRYNGIWMMPAVLDNERRANPDPRIAAFGRKVVADTVLDFRCRTPKRIVAARPGPGESGLDILGFYERNPQFTDLLSHYKVRSRTSLETFELASPLPPVARSHFIRGA